jgi:hypothetical protein
MSFRVIDFEIGKDCAVQIKTLHLVDSLYFEFRGLWTFCLTVVDDIGVLPVILFHQNQMIFKPYYRSAIVISSSINSFETIDHEFD